MVSPPGPKPKFPLHTKEPSREISKLLAETDNADIHFTLTYFELASVGSTARDLLEVAGANHTKHTAYDDDWLQGKVPTGFSYLPVLTVKLPHDKELHLAEAIVIDTFLAERFGLLGENSWEATLIRMFYTNMQYLRERTFSEVFVDPMDKRIKARAWFLERVLKKFLDDHEYHLKENGSNGHYVGDKLSLADIHLWNIIHFYGTVPWGQKAIDMFKKYPLVWKVKETVERVPRLVEWRATDEFKGYEMESVKNYSEFGLDGEDAVAPLTPVA
ncbi:hypothetical protein BGZ95_011260 [Linnemannia exigua]|uniref:GST C-terminal domain-containing protein n=1 Tax=Linnemannia exigua TaxID=604196 RepID=A0AAD4HAM7_9FUNG|nr:hypothetical protein BGZ95_011260 [Linnemannia exigua]